MDDVRRKGLEAENEVADIFRMYGQEYLSKQKLPAHHLKIMHDICVCRTEHLGGHVYKCSHCGYQQKRYNSCRNRHCPKCQFKARAKWVEKRTSEILPVGYFHLVFTIPHNMNPLILRNKTVCLNFLFKAAAETLIQFGRQKLKGQIGFIAVLHTWSQNLLDHFHIHCVVPAGALDKRKKLWNNTPNNFLFPVKAMSKMFRGKYMALLNEAFEKQQFIFPGKIANMAKSKEFCRFEKTLWKTKWIVYAKKPFADPHTVLEYLSRYTHRVAIANHRIISVRNGNVTFKYKDRKNNNTDKEMTLAVQEFIRRFLLHVLPEKFMKIRYYGFLGNRNRKENIRLCRQLINKNPVVSDNKSTAANIEEINICPQCGSGILRADGVILSYFQRADYYDTS